MARRSKRKTPGPPDAAALRKAMDQLWEDAPTEWREEIEASSRRARAAVEAFPPEWLKVQARTAEAAAKQAAEWRRDMRRSAVFAVGWIWDLLAELADEEEPSPWRALAVAPAPSPAIRWVLEHERDDLAAELLDPSTKEREAGLARFFTTLREHVAKLRDAVGMGDAAELPDTEEDAMRAAAVDGDPLLWLDESFARYLETVGETGRKLSGQVRDKARNRWTTRRQLTTDGVPENGRLFHLWFDPESQDLREQFPFLVNLALAIWRDVVWPELERERKNRERYFPAIQTRGLDALAQAVFEFGRTVEMDPDGKGATILDSSGRQVGRLAGVNTKILASIEKQIRERRRVSADFLRVFGGLVTEGHRQKAADPDDPRPDRLIIPGGWGGLCELVRVPNQTRARKAFQFGRVLELPSPDGGEILGLWKGEIIRDKGFGKRYGRLVVDVSRWLLPPRRGDQLVPILPPDREPALPADRGLTAPALLLVQYLLQHFRTYAEALEAGGVPITPDDWILLARRADLDRLDAVRAPLEQGTDDRPPLLVPLGNDRFDLAEPYADVRRFLVAGGKETARQRVKGREAQRQKEAARESPRPKHRKR